MLANYVIVSKTHRPVTIIFILYYVMLDYILHAFIFYYKLL